MQLVYFASPMCSWCWGFSPVMQQIKEKFAGQVDFRLVLAPFRVDTAEAMDAALRNYVLQQWHNVQHTTSQPFDFTFEMGQDFVYDTKPACRAIKAFSKQYGALELNYLSAIQSVFYTKNLNVTAEKVLTELAEAFKVDVELFMEELHSEEVSKLLDKDFSLCQQFGIQSYPTLIGIKEEIVTTLAYGFLPYANLEIKVKGWWAGD